MGMRSEIERAGGCISSQRRQQRSPFAVLGQISTGLHSFRPRFNPKQNLPDELNSKTIPPFFLDAQMSLAPLDYNCIFLDYIVKAFLHPRCTIRGDDRLKVILIVTCILYSLGARIFQPSLRVFKVLRNFQNVCHKFILKKTFGRKQNSACGGLRRSAWLVWSLDPSAYHNLVRIITFSTFAF